VVLFNLGDVPGSIHDSESSNLPLILVQPNDGDGGNDLDQKNAQEEIKTRHWNDGLCSEIASNNQKNIQVVIDTLVGFSNFGTQKFKIFKEPKMKGLHKIENKEEIGIIPVLGAAAHDKHKVDA